MALRDEAGAEGGGVKRALDCVCADWSSVYWAPTCAYVITDAEHQQLQVFSRAVNDERLARRSRDVGRAGLRSRGDSRLHLLGFAGELAWARLSGQPYDFRVDARPTTQDVGAEQIKTRKRHNYDLLVWSHNPPDARYVLMTGEIPRLVARGWIWGHEAKQPCWWRQPPGTQEPAYFVPVEHLHRLPFDAPHWEAT